ncbi:hypothetical protein DEGR_06870 [Deinococcus grandis]|nr:hypothetical protein DEGR_06870 [Deinococcus grandis]
MVAEEQAGHGGVEVGVAAQGPVDLAGGRVGQGAFGVLDGVQNRGVAVRVAVDADAEVEFVGAGVVAVGGLPGTEGVAAVSYNQLTVPSEWA